MTRSSAESLAPDPSRCNAQAAPRHAPTRAQLDQAAVVELLFKGPLYKADIYVINLGDGPQVIKDFGSKAWWVRLIGRLQISHECNAYQWLGPTPGIPAFYGRIDPYALSIELIAGCRIVEADNRFSDRLSHMRGLVAVAKRFLAAGFFHLDIRGRRNVMVEPDGQVRVIDFGGAWWVPPGSLRYRLVRPLLARYYRTVLFKWKKLLTLGRSYVDERSTFEKVVTYLRKPHHWGKKRGGPHPPGPEPGTGAGTGRPPQT